MELTLALMYCFDVAQDKIVWDVGHQCYTYKLLTGRLSRFATLRQENGISGFPKTEESAYDSFIAGHASTSIAVAYGLKRSMTLQGKSNHVVAVIGDGSLTGGMAYEGLNNVGKSGENLIIIINDNEMAISKNEGAVAKYLSVIRSKPGYFKVKKITEQALLSVPVAGEALRDLVAGSKTVLKQVIYPSTFFEELGFTYFGPVDGHNLQNLCDILAEAKKTDGPSIIHIMTQKGKGYAFAEQNPGAYHGVSRFDIKTGQPLKAAGESFSSVFGKELVRLAETNNRICAITAAMEHGTGLQYFGRRFKKSGRYYDVGIAEEFGVTFASALSAGGMLPVFAIYSTFLQRGYDQIIHDAAIEKRHIVLGVDRAGIVGDDGETHQGIFDVAFFVNHPRSYSAGTCKLCGVKGDA
ncbi:1-deoxy-D-xylulose-5-phosphate synthase [bioreactor metagenome]|uniref:1-deoxy-D-xylulose-5-phosphate synthase n=1 Tax=bioreactor metagenome TaxID=1076179 RepID=A0A645BYF0_9ZZZZ